MASQLKKSAAAVIAALICLLSCTCTPKTPENNSQTENNKSIDVTGVRISRADLELYVGEGFHLGAKVTPPDATNPRVTWSSDNEAVATISKEEGQVKAVSAGHATITVTTVDGGFTATCPVTVKAKNEPDPPAPSDPGAPKAFGAVPTQGQLAWQQRELLMFYHYGQATFSGYDGENEASRLGIGRWTEELLLKNYKPTTINTDQWVKVAAENGFGEIIITAKHHDGFCLWDNPESTTDVANPACSNHTDVLQGLREACNKYGVAMGIYLSPWDRMIETAGLSTSAYETKYKNALKDLMARYAPVVEMWFDGNHAGSFNWPAVNQIVFDANPECVIFSNGGPGCRWVGNEEGVAGETDWATLDIAGRSLSPSNLPGNYGSYLSSGDRGAASWCPAECDFSIQQIGDRNGWFYGASDSRKTAKDLMDLYYKSVGRNGVFLMNVPPSDKGVIDDKEVKIIEEFTRMRTAVFGTNLAAGATAASEQIRGSVAEKYGPQHLLDGNYDTYFATDDAVTTAEIEIRLDGTKTFNRVQLQEYIPLGQRVTGFEVLVRQNGSWVSWGKGTTVGYKRILLGRSVSTDTVLLKITGALSCPVLNGFGLYNDTVYGL